MPSSTPWRGRQRDSNTRAESPSRPSHDSVERLSPAPFLSPHTTYYGFSEENAREQQLVGLGLSSPSTLKGGFTVTQPDHIYIDQDGGAHVGSRTHSATKQSYTSDVPSRERRKSGARQHKTTSKQSRIKGHTRSGSTIDDLANVAIASSPTFGNQSPTFPFSNRSSRLGITRPTTSHKDQYRSDGRSEGRPAKRVRSEKLQQAEWNSKDGRPRTSHLIQQQSSMEDAELLLGLRNGYSFSTNTSPVFASASTFQPFSAMDLVQPPTMEDTTKPDNPEHLDENSNSTEAEDLTQGGEVHEQEKNQISADVMDVDPAVNEPHEEAADVQLDQSAILEATSTIDQTLKAESQPQTMPEAVPESRPTTTTKRPRKIKPEIQAEVCAACQKLQRESNGDDTTTQWICCDYCAKWFHLACGGFKDKSETRAIDKFVCKDCEPQHGQTTFVRKSSRVRTAIDYAGLNQGLVKSSEESSMHHYIQPIKDRTIKYQNDDFARIRPELLTAGFWDNMDNMKRPFVVPACWNPRFGVSEGSTPEQQDTLEAEPISEPSFITYDSHGNQITQPPSAKIPPRNTVDEDAIQDTVLDCDQDYLDMVMPRNLTVRKVAELYGRDQPVPVIDVKTQETKGQWTLSEWADYYEQKGDKPIRNVISLEVSNSPIGKLIRRPKAVRDIDLEDNVWDNETRTSSNKRPVQFYCLMSVADSYTDFHIDFGGSSVYYHILKGVKTFFFIPPEEKNLKEYEKWCNSDTQNDTWLGDLCNGNVTRVDLHEGDTAFIPAGWIHSVWTPEDSLVIGGNFLTRLDYELQLRVANIEKATKVPQKFRYPFFQKVMWYSLLKYLEDDPVPEEVLKDFHADEDFHFLRANPVWHEYDELAPDAEPGEAYYNARTYPKSEVLGLPFLRDYLYRTACVHADIPVPDINKKQIDAVKASIPKGHGDPMRLIKTFAVWCAWKTGNEAAPRWVHDHGDGLTAEIKEREKAREETFRVPPERVSARNASKVKAASPAIELVATPAKAVPSTEMNDASSTKSRSGSRGGSLRVACDACRKRRIKCRHKEGDDIAANSSPPEIRPRTYSNVSIDIPKLPSVSPVTSAFDQSSMLNGTMPDFTNTSDLAQAALATLHSQSSDSNQAVPTTPNSGSAKKGRSKACEECRKSKRRCVHDEYGRIDPAKAAEPSKPRGSSSTKRQSRTSDEHSAKRHRAESENEQSLTDVINDADIDSMIDPALMNDAFSITAIHAPTESIVMQDEGDQDALSSSIPPLPVLKDEEALLGMVHDNDDDDNDDVARSPRGAIEANPADKGSRTRLQIAIDDYNETGLSNIPAYLRQSPDVDISYSPITVDSNPVDSTEKPDVKMEDVDSVLAEPEHPLHQSRPVERHTSENHPSPSKLETKRGRDRQESSSSENTQGISVKSRRSSSNTSGTTHQAAAATNTKQRQSQEALARPDSRASSIGSDMNADERFARELQAAENGLRRRASMRA